ncbi:unnamed protein product [Symbiodinium necroappetens]|uniref:Carrier domain-containing protein n=2 Tax=Symbiodinium TaxID=2949 RepID=A0A812NWR7_9DINO|nr:hypothetical protein AK812_SmicGene49086 [Symbiodinium microadriaticum]CAE7335015.1 unnamed protein product [Symbiodinium necroappetens]
MTDTVPVVVLNLTGEILLEWVAERGTSLSKLAKKVKERKPQRRSQSVKFTCNGELLAGSSKLADVPVTGRHVELTAIIGEMSLADVMYECNVAFMESDGLELAEEDVILEGLDSFSNILLQSVLQEHFDVKLPPGFLYEFATLRAASEHIFGILQREHPQYP